MFAHILNLEMGSKLQQNLGVFEIQGFPTKKPNNMFGFSALACRDDWIRTSDHTHPMRVRYQTAPHPVIDLRSTIFNTQFPSFA